jgi:hypothetical protein
MNDPTRAIYEEVVHQALARNGLADPGEALRALLWLLRERHRMAVTAGATRAYREGFELPDPHASTVAESVEKVAARAAGNHQREHAVAHGAGSMAAGMQVIADVLRELIPLWDYEALEDATEAGLPRRVVWGGWPRPAAELAGLEP